MGPVVRLAEGGTADVDVDLAKTCKRAPPSGRNIEVAEGSLSIHAEPAEGGAIAARASLKIAAGSVPSGPNRLDLENLVVDVEGRQSADGVLGGRVGARFARVEQGGASRTVALDGKVELLVEGLRPDADQPLATARGT